MIRYIRPWFWGFLVSFVGSIPLGSLNSITVQISYAESHSQALLFAVGIALAEVIHVAVTLISMKWILRNKKLMELMHWFTITLFSAMAIGCFYSYYHPQGATGNAILNSDLNRFIMGFSLSIMDLIPIPFWFLWTNVLISKKRFEPTPLNYRIYTFGIFVGTVACQSCYITLGNLLLNLLKANINIINLFVGIVLSISILIQLYKKYSGKSVFDKIEKKQKEDPTLIH